MKDIISKINEGNNICKLFSEVQHEIDTKGEYHSYDFSEGQKKYKKGFLKFNEHDEFFAIIAFNSYKEFAEMMNTDEDAYKQYDNVKIGGCMDWGEQDGTTSQILRIW